MTTEKELNAKILEITMTINDKYPELSKYIGEIPITIPNESDPEITIKILKDYYNTLETILKNHTNNHETEK